MGLYRDESGQVIDVDDRFAEARGYTPLSAYDREDMNAQAGIEARGDERGALGGVNAALTGFESAVTLGGSDYLLGKTLTPFERERVSSEIDAHPYLRTGGEIAGALASSLEGFAGTPGGYLNSLAAGGVERGLAKATAGGTATALASMGAEGAVQSAGQYIGHASLEDKEVTAEGLTGAAGTGFAFGAGGGGAALGVVKGTVAARRLFSRVMEGKRAAEAATSSWTLASEEALAADAATARTAETKLENIRKAKMEALRARNEARSSAQEAALNRPPRQPKAPGEVDFEAGIPTDVIPKDQVPADFEAGIGTNVVPRAKPEAAPGGMPTSVFKRPGEAEGPAPLIDVGEQPQGAATSIFTKPAAPEAPAPVDIEVVRDPASPRKLVVSKGGAGDAGALARGAVPEGFSLGNLNTRTPFKIRTGIPDPGDIGPNSLYIVKPSEIAERGISGNAIKEGGVDSIRKAWEGGKKLPPVDINVTPSGKLYIEDGNHRLVAAASGDRPMAVHFKAVGEDFKPQAGARAVELGEAAVPGSPVSPQIPPRGAPPVQAGRKMGSNSINDWLSEKAAFDNGELSQAKKLEDIKGARELRNRRQETLSEIRYKATEDLLGPQVAKEEQRVADLMDEYTAARKDVEEMMQAPEPTGRANPDATVAGGPGNRKAIEILDDAHEEALLRAKHASDPQEAGSAISEAQELEDLLEGLAVPRLHGPEHPMSPSELRSPHSKAWADELMANAEKIARYEKASAALADEVGDAAHPVTAAKTKVLRDAERDAERKMYERTTRAVDDAGDGTSKPAEPSAYKQAKQRQIDAQRKLDEANVQHSEARADAAAANKKLRIGEKAKATALRADAKALRAGGKAGVDAQDVGGILEMADIPGLPKPSDLPVVGPLLGAYLKYRTLKKALGRAMGRVPATADARAAVMASQTRDRIARAVDRSVGAMERGAKASMKKSPAIAGILAARIYDDGGENPKKGASIQDLATARARELAAYVHTPGAIERDVRRQLVGVTDPDLIAATEAQRRVAMEYLLKSSPKMPEQSVLNKIDYKMSPAESMAFGRRLEAVSDPAGVFERLAHEQAMLSLEAAEALREVYPKLFSEAQQRLMQRATEGNLRVPMRSRVQLSLLYKVPLDAALDPVNFQITQSVYKREPAPMPTGMPGAAPAAPPVPSVSAPTNVAQALTPSLDRR